MTRRLTAEQIEEKRVALWHTALVAALGPSLKRCIEYMDDADGLDLLLDVARRFHASAHLLEGIRLYHRQVMLRP